MGFNHPFGHKKVVSWFKLLRSYERRTLTTSQGAIEKGTLWETRQFDKTWEMRTRARLCVTCNISRFLVFLQATAVIAGALTQEEGECERHIQRESREIKGSMNVRSHDRDTCMIRYIPSRGTFVALTH